MFRRMWWCWRVHLYRYRYTVRPFKITFQPIAPWFLCAKLCSPQARSAAEALQGHNLSPRLCRDRSSDSPACSASPHGNERHRAKSEEKGGKSTARPAATCSAGGGSGPAAVPRDRAVGGPPLTEHEPSRFLTHRRFPSRSTAVRHGQLFQKAPCARLWPPELSQKDGSFTNIVFPTEPQVLLGFFFFCSCRYGSSWTTLNRELAIFLNAVVTIYLSTSALQTFAKIRANHLPFAKHSHL